MWRTSPSSSCLCFRPASSGQPIRGSACNCQMLGLLNTSQRPPPRRIKNALASIHVRPLWSHHRLHAILQPRPSHLLQDHHACHHRTEMDRCGLYCCPCGFRDHIRGRLCPPHHLRCLWILGPRTESPRHLVPLIQRLLELFLCHSQHRRHCEGMHRGSCGAWPSDPPPML